MRLPEKLVFATNNAHKLEEARAIIGELARATSTECRVMSLAEIGCHDDVEENAATLEGNALIKARWIADRYGLPCFADDTGLEVEALGGLPGVHTARFASMENPEAASHDSQANMRLLLKRLEGVSNRKACFRTAIALIIDGEEHLFDGRVDGTIAESPCGSEGFGYDPVFIPDGYSESFAQMSPAMKNSLSHRGRALAAMMKKFQTSTI